MKIPIEELELLAERSKLCLNEDEKNLLIEDLNRTLKEVSKIDRFNADNIEISKNILNNNLKFEDLKRIVSDYNNWRRSIDRMTNDVGK